MEAVLEDLRDTELEDELQLQNVHSAVPLIRSSREGLRNEYEGKKSPFLHSTWLLTFCFPLVINDL